MSFRSYAAETRPDQKSRQDLADLTATSRRIEDQVGGLATAILSMSGELQEVVKRAIRNEVMRMAEEGHLAAGPAAMAPSPAPSLAPDAGTAPSEDPSPALQSAMLALAEQGDDPSLLKVGNFGLIRDSLKELVDRIELTRDHVSALTPAAGETDQILVATSELGSVVEATEQATQVILESAEAIQAMIDLSSNTGDLDPLLYQQLADQVIQIMTACSFQDLTGQRISASVNTLLHVEAELKRLVELWEIEEGTARADIIRNRPDDTREDKHLLHGPQVDGAGMSQGDIDSMLFG
ncbi:protein phosphatase CheZ [Novispirillum itersonii]|uniref:Chemotaxis regulatin CheY-phosphate phosphatase CheZ n=1 Tax=Novispirillum itersonii TaxID=189 RepID=A0A7X0DKF6_NOVIT|nr:protein phosphatase CheZ [Novispirillum itersonii]MBB6208908.1 chemotaxis regulatin CheY-phosphate phosphatase CheZ [Novispirillum itersonii]